MNFCTLDKVNCFQIGDLVRVFLNERKKLALQLLDFRIHTEDSSCNVYVSILKWSKYIFFRRWLNKAIVYNFSYGNYRENINSLVQNGIIVYMDTISYLHTKK